MTPERTEKLLKVLSQRQNNLTVVLENVQDPRNITAVMRSCESVGIQHIYIINTQAPRIEKFGYKSGSSAAKWLTIHQYASVTDCFVDVRKLFDKVFTTHLSSDAIDVYSINFTENIALVFGNEHSGVSEEARSLADGNFIIPQVGIIQSLNISVACAVSIYEAFRQKRIAGHYQQSTLQPQQMQELQQQWGFNLE